MGSSKPKPTARPPSASHGPAGTTPGKARLLSSTPSKAPENTSRLGMRRQRTSCQTAAPSSPHKIMAGLNVQKE